MAVTIPTSRQKTFSPPLVAECLQNRQHEKTKTQKIHVVEAGNRLRECSLKQKHRIVKNTTKRTNYQFRSTLTIRKLIQFSTIGCVYRYFKSICSMLFSQNPLLLNCGAKLQKRNEI